MSNAADDIDNPSGHPADESLIDESLIEEGRSQMRKIPGWFAMVGRIGYAAKGVVYTIVGFLAFKLAIGSSDGETGGSKNAVREIGEQPMGRWLLGLVAIGLIAYVIWRWLEAFKDPDNVGSDLKGIARRIGYFISGLLYTSTAWLAASIAMPSVFGGSGGRSGWSRSGFLLDSTAGRVALALFGLFVISFAIREIHKGFEAKFMSDYYTGEMSEMVRTVAYHAGRMGLITRGIAVSIIGVFLIQSAYRGTNGGDTAGMDDALSLIATAPFGKILIGIVGFGLMAYALHLFMVSRYRAFHV